MKTLKDLEEMKTQAVKPFGSAYEYFFMNLVDWYISKVNGVERINNELLHWDMEARQVIVAEVEKRVRDYGIEDFEL